MQDTPAQVIFITAIKATVWPLSEQVPDLESSRNSHIAWSWHICCARVRRPCGAGGATSKCGGPPSTPQLNAQLYSTHVGSPMESDHGPTPNNTPVVGHPQVQTTLGLLRDAANSLNMVRPLQSAATS